MNISHSTLRRVTAISLVVTLALASFFVGNKLWTHVENNSYSA